MFRRTLVLVTLLAMVGAFGLFVPAAQAVTSSCLPNLNSYPELSGYVSCDDDAAVFYYDSTSFTIPADALSYFVFDSVSSPSVKVKTGNVLFSLTDIVKIKGDGYGYVVAGTLGTATFGNVINITGDGLGYLNGDFIAGGDGIHLGGDGIGIIIGSIAAGDDGIDIGGDGMAILIGSIHSADDGIDIGGDGVVFNLGDISGLLMDDGIEIGDDGAVLNAGTIAVTGDGIHIGDDGFVVNTNQIISGGDLIDIGSGAVLNTGNIGSGDVGIQVRNDGFVINLGNILALGDGVHVGDDGIVYNDGNITAKNGIRVEGDGVIVNDGVVNAANNGIRLDGDGAVIVNGEVNSQDIGVRGGSGDQEVIVNGVVDAPIAVRLGNGDDRLDVSGKGNVTGDVEMGGGDDTVVVYDDAVVDGTMYGGETGETYGDVLIIGSGMYCSEDVNDNNTATKLNSLNPDGGDVTYRGQTYTWAEFEHIASGMRFSPCFGRINDGRINAYDLAAPAALYCTVDAGVSIWAIDTEGQGTFSFYATHDQVEAAFTEAVASGVNQMIGQDDHGNAIYALSDGHSIQFMGPQSDGKTYQYHYERDFCG